MLKEPTEEAMERITEAQCRGEDCYGVTIHDTHMINACNHIYSGTVLIGKEAYGFIIESGDNNGTVIIEWGPDGDVGFYEPEPPGEPLTFVPIDRDLSKEMMEVYHMWRKEPWFKEKESGYLYDRHFAPGGKTESHYRDWAKAKGMKIGYLSEI